MGSIVKLRERSIFSSPISSEPQRQSPEWPIPCAEIGGSHLSVASVGSGNAHNYGLECEGPLTNPSAAGGRWLAAPLPDHEFTATAVCTDERTMFAATESNTRGNEQHSQLNG